MPEADVAAVDAVIIDRMIVHNDSYLVCHDIGDFSNTVASLSELVVDRGTVGLANFT